MERETVPAPPSLFWSKVARSPASQTLSLTFALKLPAASAEQLNRAFHAVSNPRNPSYGAYWSQADVLALLAPSPASVNTVATFLAARGATSIDVVGNLISVTMTVAQAEAAFATTISKFEHRARRASVHRASRAYSLPLEVGVVVATIDGLLLLPRLRGTQAHADAEPNASSLGMTPWLPGTCGGACPGWLTPAIISKRYNLGAAPLTAHNGTSLAVAEFLFNYWDEGDIDSFAKACSLSGMGVLKQIGHNSPAEASIEAMLDIEYANALGGAIPLTDVALSSYQLLEWAKLLLALDPVPLVHSVSYGSDEAQQSSAGFMEACNTQFKALALRGVSLLFASGDQGVCGREGCGSDAPFHPDFPASSPYVTAVGATDFAKSSAIGEEKAWGSSGGGFSNHFAMPIWQRDAVAAYKSAAAATLPPAALWNATGRGYPDLAALGGQSNPYCVFHKGTPTAVSGTSAATPVVAAIFARLNDIKLAKGAAPLGFLNPFIYQNSGAFNDVTLGCNAFTGSHGFSATPGWDPATGIGTPNFSKLALLM